MIGVVFGLSCALALAGPWSPADAPSFSDAEGRALADVVTEARSIGPSAGLSVGVLLGDRVYRAAWGFAEHQPHRRATVASTYRAASITKSFTALVAMQLAAEKKLDLDADVRGYVPSFAAKDAPITPRQLLSHTSGIAHYRGNDDAMTRVPYTTAQSLAIFSERPLVDAPGGRFVYSSFGYNLLGAALESVTHESFGALLRARIFGPLGMEHTRLETGPRGKDDAAGYRLDGTRLIRSERIDITSRFASGGTRTTVDDLLRFSRALIEGGLVDQAAWRAMTTPTVTADGRQADYGLGFAVYPLRGRRVVAHAGGQPETSSLILLVPEERFAVVLLTNLEGQGPALSALASSLLEVALDGGTPRRDLYADDVVDSIVLDGMSRIFSHGRAAFALEPAAANDQRPEVAREVARAFAALPALFSRVEIAARPALSREALRDAYHPAAGRVSPLVGHEMARVIARSTTPAREPLAFFAQYLDACEPARAKADAGKATLARPSSSTCPHPLPPTLAADARRFAAARSATPAALLALRPEHVDASLASLRPLVGSALHVSFIDDLERVATRARNAGRSEDARAALELSASLHPGSPRVQVALAELDVTTGAVDDGRDKLVRAWAMPAAPLELTRDALRKRRFATKSATEAWRAIVAALPEPVEGAPPMAGGG